jgi:hypothetical protein
MSALLFTRLLQFRDVLHQQGSHRSMIYRQISIFVFLNLLNQFLTIFWAFWHPLFIVIFFDNIFYFLFFLRERKNVNWRITQKWVMTKKEDKVKYNPIYIIHGHTYWNIISKDSSNVSFLGSMEFIGIRRSLPNREFFFRPSFDC